MNIKDRLGSDFLKAEDLGNSTPKVVICGVSLLSIQDEERVLLRFEGKAKGLVMNKTNLAALAEVWGEETDEWLDRSLVLYTENVQYQGKTVKGVRVRPTPGEPPPAKPKGDDIPF